MRIELAPRVALVTIGVGEREITTCLGAIDGVATGPEVGDLGDWHAAPLQQGSGSIPSASPSPTTGTRACASGLTRCGAACVDLSTDRNHCGACNTLCPDMGGLVCAAGRCGCPAGWVDCSQAPGAPEGIDGYCADLRSNAGNCGACGFSCATGETCGDGRCRGTGAAQCARGLTDCGGICVDLQSDLNNCGACGEICESGLVPVECRSGVCERATCPVGMSIAARSTAAATSPPIPDTAEPAPMPVPAVSATVAFADRQGQPAQQAMPTAARAASISAAMTSTAAPAATAAMTVRSARVGRAPAAQQQYAAGLTDCAGTCANLQTNPFHCGACGTVCPGADTDANPCIAGICVDQCTAHGLGNCPGGCRDLASDPAHCGACGHSCASRSGLSGRRLHRRRSAMHGWSDRLRRRLRQSERRCPQLWCLRAGVRLR